MSSTTKHKTDVVPKTKTFNSVKSGSVDADEMLCLRKSSMAGDAMGIISKKLHDKRKGGRSKSENLYRGEGGWGERGGRKRRGLKRISKTIKNKTKTPKTK